jgi:hypothetical protein
MTQKAADPLRRPCGSSRPSLWKVYSPALDDGTETAVLLLETILIFLKEPLKAITRCFFLIWQFRLQAALAGLTKTWKSLEAL